MRKVTEQTATAFKNITPIKIGNTRVSKFDTRRSMLYLHGNMIADLDLDEKTLYITNCGYFTNTTKERLNGVLGKFGLHLISQRNFKWFIGSEKFEGNKLFKL